MVGQMQLDLTSAGPARLYNIACKGRIAAGYDADFTVVDLKRSEVITDKWIASKAGWTPYDGMRVTGYCRGGLFGAAGREKFQAAVDDNKRMIDEAAAIGAECIVVIGGGLAPGSRDLPGLQPNARKQTRVEWRQRAHDRNAWEFRFHDLKSAREITFARPDPSGLEGGDRPLWRQVELVRDL